MTNKQQLIAAIALFMAVLWGMAYVMEQITREHWAVFPVFTTSTIGLIGSAVWAYVILIRIVEGWDK
jgi:hypothetical protein